MVIPAPTKAPVDKLVDGVYNLQQGDFLQDFSQKNAIFCVFFDLYSQPFCNHFNHSATPVHRLHRQNILKFLGNKLPVFIVKKIDIVGILWCNNFVTVL